MVEDFCVSAVVDDVLVTGYLRAHAEMSDSDLAKLRYKILCLLEEGDE